MKSKILRYILLLILPWQIASANGDQPHKRIYTTAAVNPHPPVIDGALDDAAWQKVAWSSDFIQRSPDDGAEPSFESAFKLLYDNRNLYVAIRAFDPEPGKIESRITRRDQFDGDWVQIALDTYFDQRTAFAFIVNAAGVKGDAAITKDGENEDENWDPVWYVKTKIDAKGWTAEMRIPFSQLRFGEKDHHIWGLQVQREIFRKDERSSWQYIPRTAAGFVSLFGELHGIRDIKSSRRIELLPYSVGQFDQSEKIAGNPFRDGRDGKLNAGLDGKMGVTSDLTLDFTVNPDFGQVEADPSELNLTAFETFFEEKRPFFIEGRDILRFNLTGGDGSFSGDQLFYTRRVGRSPQFYYEAGEDEVVDRPQNSSIVAAAKLTGKTKSGISVGLFNALTQKENVEIDRNGKRSKVPVEPQTNYLVGRLQKDFDQGNTIIGGMITATNRNISASHLKILPHAAYTGGVDLMHQWQNKTYYVNFKTAFSTVRGTREAMLDLQTNPRHYYQRPDAHYIELDSSRTALNGFAATLDFGKSGNGNWMYATGVTMRSPGLDLNDLGFLRSADNSMQFIWVGYRINNPVAFFRALGINFNQWTTWNFDAERLSSGGNINGWGQFKNYWRFNYGIARNGQRLSASALRGGPSFRTEGAWRIWTHLMSDTRKKLRLGGGLNGSLSDDGFARRWSTHIDFIYRPANTLSFSIQPFFTVNYDDFQYRGTEELSHQKHYILARLKQKTANYIVRIDYSITPELSIQYYGSPYISSGNYSHFKDVRQARADRVSDRFMELKNNENVIDDSAEDYALDLNGDGSTDAIYGTGFNFREFNSNLVLRWEYNPGSTIYLVWSQSRFGNGSNGSFSYSDDFSELFSDTAENIFLVKYNRWFSF